MAFKSNITGVLDGLFGMRIITIAQNNFRGAYEELYSNITEYPSSTIGKIERDLVKLEVEETGSDKIHWEVWNEFKNRVEIQDATGDIPYAEIVD